jgi:hypothetical protein
MERIDLQSTALAWVQYRSAEEALRIGIRDGDSYEYSGVPEQTYRELLAAESKGRYYNHHIRNDFPCQPLRQPGPG